MGVLKEDHTCAEVRYLREDNFGASSFISAAIERNLRIYILHVSQKTL